MKNILFVCHGNICRSPMAEAIFRKKADDLGRRDEFFIDSAGIASYHKNEPPHKGTIEVLRENNISFAGIKSRQITKDDFMDFDYIIAMDEQNLSALLKMKPKNSVAVVKLLSTFVDEDWVNVPDPWYSGDFHLVYQLIEKGCQKIIAIVN